MMRVLVNKNGPNQQEGTAPAQLAIAAIKPLCDVCVQIGIFNVSMERDFLDAWEGVTWTCTAHHRVYHPLIGYQSREGNSLVHQCSEGCCVNMCIQKADAPNLVAFACPKCGHATPASLHYGIHRI